MTMVLISELRLEMIIDAKIFRSMLIVSLWPQTSVNKDEEHRYNSHSKVF